MAKSFKKKKLPKYPMGGFLDKTKDLGLYLADNALTTTTGGLGANIIKQNQYNDTGFGRELGKNEAYKESFDAMSPLAKMGTKTGIVKHDQESTGMSDAQQANYNQAAPFAQMGSKIGEMWAGQGLAGITGKTKKDANGNSISGSGQSLSIDKMTGMAMDGNYVAQNPNVQPNQPGVQFQSTGGPNYYNPNDPNNPQLVGQGKFPLGGMNMFPDGGQYKRTIRPIGMKLSNDEIVNHVKGLMDGSINEGSLRDSLSDTDWNRVNSLYQSPQGQAFRPKESNNMNFIMPNKSGSYVDSGVNPSEAILPGMMSRAANISNDIANNNKISQAIPKLKAYIDEMTKSDKAVMQAQEAARKYSKNLDLKKGLVQQDQEFRKKFDWYYPNNSKSVIDNWDNYANGGSFNSGVIHAPELGGYFRKRK